MVSAHASASELQPLVALFGEYVVRCLVSKVWALREAALTKARLRLKEFEAEHGAEALVAPYCTVLKMGVEDKIAQVYISTLDLLDECARAFGDARGRARLRACVRCVFACGIRAHAACIELKQCA